MTTDWPSPFSYHHDNSAARYVTVFLKNRRMTGITEDSVIPVILSIKSPVFMDKIHKPAYPSIKSTVFMDKIHKSNFLSIKSPVFMDKESAKGLEPFQSV